MKRIAWIGILLALGAAVYGWWGQAAKLFVNGNLASSGVIERNGTAYVPIKDVAAALKMSVRKTARGYELADSGGANMLGGIEGGIGEELWNGFGRFKVVNLIRTKKYLPQFSGDGQFIEPYPAGHDLIVVVCRIKNGTKQTVTCGLPGGENTALTDDDEHSFGPYTGASVDIPTRGASLLPGSAVDFALTFSVPPNARLKDLVYELVFYGVLDASKKKFRVKLSDRA